MARNLVDYAIIGLKGMAMGAADVVPGVSGGTIAFITGIYEELVNTIDNVSFGLIKSIWQEGLATFWKKANGPFIAALFTGILISIFSLAKLFSYLLETYPILVWSFFFGLVLASVFLVGKQIKKWSWQIILVFIAGAAAAYFITSLPVQADTNSLVYLFFSGALAICAMILPGISGSFILVLLGSYKIVLDAVNNLNFTTIAVFGAGAVVGLLSFAKLLKWMFTNYRELTLAVLTGFILGSLNKIWPWKIVETKKIGDKIKDVAFENILPQNYTAGDSQLMMAVVLAIVGFALIFLLEKLASAKPKNSDS